MANAIGWIWVRTCQECGYVQASSPPDSTKELSDAYRNRKCRQCHSESLDYGSYTRVLGVTDDDEEY